MSFRTRVNTTVFNLLKPGPLVPSLAKLELAIAPARLAEAVPNLTILAPTAILATIDLTSATVVPATVITTRAKFSCATERHPGDPRKNVGGGCGRARGRQCCGRGSL